MKLLRCHAGEFTQEQVLGPVTWPFFDLLVIHQGQIEISTSKQSLYTLAREEALLIYPNTYFSGRVLSAKSLVSVQHFSLEQGDEYFSLSHLSFLTDLSNGAKHYSMNKLIIADIERSLAYHKTSLSEAYVAQMQSSLLNLILGQLTNKKEDEIPNMKYKASFNKLIDSYTENLKKPINIDDMAEQVRLSSSHFRAEFFKLFGEPPKRYLLCLKMKVACQLLAQGQLPIQCISAHLGYEDTGTFYRHFKKIVQITPLQYRKVKQVNGR